MKNRIKRSIFLVIAVLAVLGAAAAAEAPMTAGMPNPWIEAESIEALNEAAGVNLHLPGVMGITDVAYRLMDTEELTIAELDFRVNGMAYMLRASGEMAADISGVYTDDGNTAFCGCEYEGLSVKLLDDCKLARWVYTDGQYVLMVNDEGTMDAETFEAIVSEMMDITSSFRPAAIAEGVYYDPVSGRAYAEVTAAGDNVYAIRIHWADSAVEDNVWTMTASVGEDGLLSYYDCVLKHVVTAEDGTDAESEADAAAEGWFEIADGKLLWTGADDESCRACVFELYTE
ncbi:MAG: hypothetical protein Q4G19_02450 [Clostridia bacterium]|nr:hypothetical protein [Clostridia bacterium]